MGPYEFLKNSNLVFPAALFPLTVSILSLVSVLVPLLVPLLIPVILVAILVVMVTTPASVTSISVTIPGREGSHFK